MKTFWYLIKYGETSKGIEEIERKKYTSIRPIQVELARQKEVWRYSIEEYLKHPEFNELVERINAEEWMP